MTEDSKKSSDKNVNRRRGIRHHNWKGGRKDDGYGYILIRKPQHPRAEKQGYVREHILVYEEYHKCCLLRWAVIHHINEVRNDNRPENLMAFCGHRPHTLLHHPRMDMSNRKCVQCGSHKTNDRHWYSNGTLCRNCFRKNKYVEFQLTSEKKVCECGACNELISVTNKRGEPAHFKHGHNRRKIR